jgi:hypothetical protein
MSDSPKDPETKPQAPATNTSQAPAPAPAAAEKPVELREDVLKSAVSFLTSPNVQSADKGKKIAFLQKKGLNQAEIDEAFKRAGRDSSPSTTSAVSVYH